MSLDHEGVVIRALLTDREMSATLARRLTPDHFYDRANRVLWGSVAKCAKHGGATPAMVADMLARSSAGTEEVRSKIVARAAAFEGMGVPDPAEVSYALDFLRKQRLKEDLRDRIAQADAALADGDDPLMVMEDIRGSFAEAEQQASEDEFIDTAREPELGAVRLSGEPYPTGIEDLDSKSAGGFYRGTFSIFGGFAGSGKSRQALAWCVDWVKDFGARVLWVSVEMPVDQVQVLAAVAHANKHMGQKIDSMAAVIPEFRGLTAEEREAVHAAAHDLWGDKDKGGIVFWHTKPDHTARDVTEFASGAGRVRPFDAVIVDYAGILSPVRDRSNRTDEHADTLTHMHRWCSSCFGGRGTRLISLWQIRRASMESGRRYFVMGDFAESAAVERTVHWLGWSFRDEVLEDKQRAIVGICKNRFGPCIRRGIEIRADLKYIEFGGDAVDVGLQEASDPPPVWTMGENVVG